MECINLIFRHRAYAWGRRDASIEHASAQSSLAVLYIFVKHKNANVCSGS